MNNTGAEPASEADITHLLRRLSKAGLPRLPKKHKDRRALLALSLMPLKLEGIYDEQEIDAHLIRWITALAGDGPGVDHVTWRRALVDFGFLRRATDGAIYRIREDAVLDALTPGARQLAGRVL